MPTGFAAIMKKEFVHVFTDFRLVFTTIIMPGLLIYVIYSFIGSSIATMYTVDPNYQPSIYTVNLPASVESLFSQADISVTPASDDEIDEVKLRIESKKVDTLIVFPEDFDSIVANRYEVSLDEYIPPNIMVFYNSTRIESLTAYSVVSSALEMYKVTLSPVYSVNVGDENFDLATEQDTTGSMLASLLPILILVFLFSGCVAVAPESIAGEKERGTIATLLVTPLRRWELALGKVVSLGIIALMAGASSFLGVILSLPKILEGRASGQAESTLDTLLYGPGDFVMLLAVILSTVLLFIGIITVLSAFARTVREANSLVLPLMVIVMLVGTLGMFSRGGQTDFWYYLIPVYNSAQSLVGVLSFSSTPLFVALTVGINLVITGVCVFLLTKMFSSEKVMFKR